MNYTYNEIQDMQRRAMERVSEMKKNTDMVTQSAQREFNKEISKTDSQEYVKPKITNMPPNFPKDNTYPSFKSIQEEIGSEKEEEKTTRERNNNPIENLFAEPDKALLLGLIMLLKSEHADETLIMALTYILS